MKPSDWINQRFPLWSTELDWNDHEMWNMPMYARNARGVYVIYLPFAADPARVLYVGKGFIRNRCVNIHNGVDSRFNKTVKWMEFDKYDLRVAWAEVDDEAIRRGVEAYLAERLWPVAGKVWHTDYPVEVNLPAFQYRTMGSLLFD